MLKRWITAGFLTAGLLPASADWRQFRGPTGDGIYPAAEGKLHGFPTEWSEDKNIVWKTPITGRAWSTPVVMGDQVWATNATEDGKKMYAVCLDKATGKKLHDLLLFENAEPEPLSNHVNGYGSCSPAIDEERVYIHFGSYGTAAIDTADGKVAWQRTDLDQVVTEALAQPAEQRLGSPSEDADPWLRLRETAQQQSAKRCGVPAGLRPDAQADGDDSWRDVG